MTPEHGWSFVAEVVGVVDGDTIKVRVSRILTVRLIDCWAPESRTKDKAEKERGLAAKGRMQELAPVGSQVTVFVPASGRGMISELFTMGRVLGRVWSQGCEISEVMCQEGYASKERP